MKKWFVGYGWSAVLAFVGAAALGCSDEGGGGGDADAGVIDPCEDPHAWCEFGRDPENSRHNGAETAISTDNVDQLELAWEFPAEGSGETFGCTSTPMVADGTVYVGTWAGDVAALDAQTGEVQWRSEVQGPVDSTVAVTTDRVYASDGAGFVHALRRSDGHILWTTEADPTNEYVHMYSSPRYIEDADLIVVGVASIEVAIPGLEDYTFRGSVLALDAETGAEEWRVRLAEDDETSGAGVSVWSTVAVDSERKMVFIGTGQSYEEPASEYSDALVAIDYESGELMWSRQFTEDDVFTIFGEQIGPDWDVGASPNLFQIDGEDVVGVADKRGVYSAMDRETGQDVKWATMLGPGSELGGVMSTAVYHDGVIYVASNEWAEGGQGDYELEGNMAHLWALDAASGDEVWQEDIPSPNFGALTMANGVLYVPTITGELYAIDAADGSVRGMIEGLEDMGGGVSVSDGMVYVPHGFEFFADASAAEGGLRAYRLP
ncbi:MAG: PQQ-binding-like beta-propeller repeat protein [Myxococcota bacterium]